MVVLGNYVLRLKENLPVHLACSQQKTAERPLTTLGSQRLLPKRGGTGISVRLPIDSVHSGTKESKQGLLVAVTTLDEGTVIQVGKRMVGASIHNWNASLLTTLQTLPNVSRRVIGEVTASNTLTPINSQTVLYLVAIVVNKITKTTKAPLHGNITGSGRWDIPTTGQVLRQEVIPRRRKPTMHHKKTG